MIATISPVMETGINSISMDAYMACGAIATALLISALIIRELLDSSNESHHRHAVLALDTAIPPLSIVFAVMVAYKVLEVLRF